MKQCHYVADANALGFVGVQCVKCNEGPAVHHQETAESTCQRGLQTVHWYDSGTNTENKPDRARAAS